MSRARPRQHFTKLLYSLPLRINRLQKTIISFIESKVSFETSLPGSFQVTTLSIRACVKSRHCTPPKCTHRLCATVARIYFLHGCILLSQNRTPRKDVKHFAAQNTKYISLDSGHPENVHAAHAIFSHNFSTANA